MHHVEDIMSLNPQQSVQYIQENFIGKSTQKEIQLNSSLSPDKNNIGSDTVGSDDLGRST
jgi:23S rRNA U2552 (ribose-2'-O)-methylase RlmE/FtsJ